MTRLEQIRFLNRRLLDEMPEYREQARAFPPDEAEQRRLLRCLMNVRPPLPLDAEFLRVQDELLSAVNTGADKRRGRLWYCVGRYVYVPLAIILCCVALFMHVSF